MDRPINPMTILLITFVGGQLVLGAAALLYLGRRAPAPQAALFVPAPPSASSDRRMRPHDRRKEKESGLGLMAARAERAA